MGFLIELIELFRVRWLFWYLLMQIEGRTNLRTEPKIPLEYISNDFHQTVLLEQICTAI